MAACPLRIGNTLSETFDDQSYYSFMTNLRLGVLALYMALSTLTSWAQMNFPQVSGERVDADKAIERSLKVSALTYEGKPFHAIMQIGQPNTPYSGSVEVWWIGPSKYRTIATTPRFTQEKIVNGPLIEEKNDGDYYPRWLEDLVDALIDPLPVADNFRGHGGAVMLGEQITSSCLRRDDRPGGITDQTTWGLACFSGSELHLERVQTFNHSISYSDWRKFGKKQIARTYETDVLDYQPVQGHLLTLDELKSPNEKMFAISTPTSPEQRIQTTLVSTLKEESMVEHAPVIQWPTVREGKTEGYLIVYARTDKTGQVRETAKHNSDQPGLEQFGMEQALKFKFKPLMVNGVAEQMEMPLVLHFTSHIADALPILTVEQMKKQMPDCSPGKLPPGTPSVTVRVSVNETGKMTGAGPLKDTPGGAWLSAVGSLESCHYLPYVVNGVASYYKGDVELTAP